MERFAIGTFLREEQERNEKGWCCVSSIVVPRGVRQALNLDRVEESASERSRPVLKHADTTSQRCRSVCIYRAAGLLEVAGEDSAAQERKRTRLAFACFWVCHLCAGAGRAGNKPSTVETNGATLGASVSSSSSTSTGPQGEEETKAVGAGTAGMSLSKLITSTKKGKFEMATGHQ